MRGVECAVHDDRAVEMPDGTVAASLPLLHERAALLVVLANRLGVDSVEVPRVDGDTLVGLGNDELGDLFSDYAGGELGKAVALIGDPTSAWCDDIATPEAETCPQQATAAFRKAVGKLANAYGGDLRAWRWGDAHKARFSHPLFDRIPILRDLLHEPIATDGDNFTVNRATPRIDFESVVYPDVHGAGLRAVFDLADLDRSLFIIAGGQSGHPLSAHYGDQIERWRDGRYIELRGGGEVLTLVPDGR